MASETDLPAPAVDTLLPVLEQLRQRNTEALETLYTRTVDQLHALAIRIVGAVEDAEDVLSEVFLQVWQKPDKYDATRGSVMAWLVIMVRSRALDLLRKRSRTPLSERMDELEDILVAKEAPLDDLVEKNRYGLRLHQALHHLTPMQRRMIELAFFEGLTHAQITQRTGQPLGTVKSHLRRAQLHLEATLAEQTSFPQSAPRKG